MFFFLHIFVVCFYLCKTTVSRMDHFEMGRGSRQFYYKGRDKKRHGPYTEQEMQIFNSSHGFPRNLKVTMVTNCAKYDSKFKDFVGINGAPAPFSFTGQGCRKLNLMEHEELLNEKTDIALREIEKMRTALNRLAGSDLPSSSYPTRRDDRPESNPRRNGNPIDHTSVNVKQENPSIEQHHETRSSKSNDSADYRNNRVSQDINNDR
ncbi:hypothetical protein PENTCL1PPCAC_28683 [Pristionchus entomophagus]|uniref:Uncharacterized protein n=1 Tax=Pristionchus entomophagus TaxID=358040 RepID=A0AAV5UJF8_9BILA|nr:hypothetical protein PENTCL1PPCAC_28683 [Pristionchus entomophagus]